MCVSETDKRWDIFSHLIVSVEAHFHIDGYANKQNYRFWGVMIEYRLNMHDCWFQQDGATAHKAKETMTILRAALPGRLISRFSDFSCPPRSPDLTYPDSFLWGYLKGKVYLNKPNTLQEIKNNIIEEISLINPAVLESVSENTAKRMRICLNNDEKHLKNITLNNKTLGFPVLFVIDLIYLSLSGMPESCHWDILPPRTFATRNFVTCSFATRNFAQIQTM